MSTSPPFPPRVLSIQSTVVSGHVGLCASTFPLQLLGWDVNAMATASLSSHTGHARVAPLAPPLDGARASVALAALSAGGALSCCSAVLSGYLPDAGAAAALAAALRDGGPLQHARFVCDPVLGDAGRLYVPAAMIAAFRDELAPLASLLTPNAFEAEALTGVAVTDARSACAAFDVLHERGSRAVVITSAEMACAPGALLLLASCPWEDVADDAAALAGRRGVGGGGAHARFAIAVRRMPLTFSGTGDLLAALLLAHTAANPRALVTACLRALATTQAVCARTAARHAACNSSLAAERASGAPPSWLAAAAAAHAPGAATIPAFNELCIIESRGDIERPEAASALLTAAAFDERGGLDCLPFPPEALPLQPAMADAAKL